MGGFNATLEYEASSDFELGKKEFADMLPNVVTPRPGFLGGWSPLNP